MPSRPKSRNDMEDRMGVGTISGQRGVKHPQDFTKELDVMQWYEDVEDELQEASNNEYMCVIVSGRCTFDL